MPFFPTSRSAAAFIYPLLIATATFTMNFTSETNLAEFKKRARVLKDYNIPFPMTVDLAFFARFPNVPKVWNAMDMSYQDFKLIVEHFKLFPAQGRRAEVAFGKWG